MCRTNRLRRAHLRAASAASCISGCRISKGRCWGRHLLQTEMYFSSARARCLWKQSCGGTDLVLRGCGRMWGCSEGSRDTSDPERRKTLRCKCVKCDVKQVLLIETLTPDVMRPYSTANKSSKNSKFIKWANLQETVWTTLLKNTEEQHYNKAVTHITWSLLCKTF